MKVYSPGEIEEAWEVRWYNLTRNEMEFRDDLHNDDKDGLRKLSLMF